MRQLLWGLALGLAAGLPLLFITPAPAVAQTCTACLDGNGDGLCGNAADTVVPDSDWLNGTGSGAGGNFPGATFVLPPGCSKIVTTAVSGGIRVNARRIFLRGQLTSTPTGGLGMLFTATEDIQVDQVSGFARPKLESGGANTLTNNAANAGVAKASVGLRAGTSCNLFNADLTANPITVSGSGQIGIQCNGRIDLHGNSMLASGIDIQSLNGPIMAFGSVSQPRGIECDSSALNSTAGNNNNQVDAGDFTCTMTFASEQAKTDFCDAGPGLPPNIFRARGNPLVMIAKTDIRLDNPTYPGNIGIGFYNILLIAQDGNIDTTNADLLNHLPTPIIPADAGIFVFANPASVARSPVLDESATGPNTGNLTIAGACYQSAKVVSFGTTSGNPIGTPKAGQSSINTTLCKQFFEFVPVVSGP
jgi:hypothetical protein